MSDLPEAKNTTDIQQSHQTQVTPSKQFHRNNDSKGNNGQRRHQQSKLPKLSGDLEAMGGNVLCTSDENCGCYLSHKDVIRILKGQSSRFIRKGHNDFRKMWDGEADPMTAIPGPTVPESLLGESPNVVDRLTYTEQLKMVNSRRENFNNNLSLTWDLIWGQCTLHMRNKLMMDEGFDDALETANLSQIRSMLFLTLKWKMRLMSKWQKTSCGSLSGSAADFTTLT